MSGESDVLALLDANGGVKVSEASRFVEVCNAEQKVRTSLDESAEINALSLHQSSPASSSPFLPSCPVSLLPAVLGANVLHACFGIEQRSR